MTDRKLVHIVDDEEAIAALSRRRLLVRSRVAGGDEHVAGVGLVALAVARTANDKVGKRPRQPFVPLGDQYPGGYNDQYEDPAAMSVGDCRQRHIGLARSSHRFHDAAAPAPQPRCQRIELPLIEKALGPRFGVPAIRGGWLSESS